LEVQFRLWLRFWCWRRLGLCSQSHSSECVLDTLFQKSRELNARLAVENDVSVFARLFRHAPQGVKTVRKVRYIYRLVPPITELFCISEQRLVAGICFGRVSIYCPFAPLGRVPKEVKGVFSRHLVFDELVKAFGSSFVRLFDYGLGVEWRVTTKTWLGGCPRAGTECV
jgi:hypothetical protein